MTTASAPVLLDFGTTTIHRNLSTPHLYEHAIKRGEGILAANGTLAVDTGERTGRSPGDKHLEDTPGIHGNIDWGKINQPISPENFTRLEEKAMAYLKGKDELYRFDGYAGADPAYRLKVTVITELAWHALFARTLFINAEGTGTPSLREGGTQPYHSESGGTGAPPNWEQDWTIINACDLKIDNYQDYGLKSPLGIIQSLEQKKVIIMGTQYAGEMKKSIFYAMNYDLPDMGVFPMHCSANVDKNDPDNVAIFFGLSGTGKTTLSADPDRPIIGDDEHGWSGTGVFNIEGGCYAKCIKLRQETEPQIWDAIKFGSCLENTVIDEVTRVPDYDDSAKTENTRVTYPVEFIPGAVIPSVGTHPRNVIFLTADAFGVLPPVSKLTREQAMYYFINGYTSKLAGTEAGVTEPLPNFSPCFGGPFLPRPPKVYAEMLAERIVEHDANVWLLNTGWTGGPYGEGERFSLKYTRAFVTAILNGSLASVDYEQHPIFGLHMPTSAPNVPSEVLNPVNTWKDKAAYDTKANDLAGRFRANDQKYDIPDEVRAAGPRVG